MTSKEWDITYHCAVSPDLNDSWARSVLSLVGTTALVGFLEEGTLEEEAAGLAFGAVDLPGADILGSKTRLPLISFSTHYENNRRRSIATLDPLTGAREQGGREYMGTSKPGK